VIDFAKQFKEVAEAAKDACVDGRFDRVIFCGMGGSAIPAEMITMLWLDKLNPYIQRGFGLPPWVNKNCLVICVSWSGDTEETISSFVKAQELALPLVAITKGGQLLKLAQNSTASLVTLPQDDLPARFGLGYMFAAILTLLGHSAIIEDNLDVLNFLSPSTDANLFSSRIGSKTPLIYSSYQWRYLARHWKIHFNEDCKIHSFSNYFPEAAHNELAAYGEPRLMRAGFNQTNKESYFPIILVDPEEEQADIQKLSKFASFLTSQGIDHEIINLDGKNRFQKILKNVNQAVSISTELAKSLGVNPFDAALIEGFNKS